MKILIVSHYFPPTNTIAAHRTYSWAKYWTLLGHNVTVLTTEKKSQNDDMLVENLGFEIRIAKVRFVSLLSNSKGILNKVTKIENSNLSLIDKIKRFFTKRGAFSTIRLPDLIDVFTHNAYNLVKNEHWDLVVSSFGPPFSHRIGYRLKSNSKTRFWIADYRDLWTQHPYFKGIWIFRIFEKYLEKKYNTNADYITTVSEPLADKIAQTINSKKKLRVIENGYEDKDFVDVRSKIINYPIKLIYTGTIYEKFDFDPLFKAIKMLVTRNVISKTNFSFEIYGNNSQRISPLIVKRNLEHHIRVFTSVTYKESLKIQRDADLLIFMGYEDIDNLGLVSGKLYEYIMSGSHIWAFGITELSTPGQLIINSNSGELLPNKEEVITQKLSEVIIKRKLVHKEIDFSYMRQFKRETLAKKMIDLIIS